METKISEAKVPVTLNGRIVEIGFQELNTLIKERLIRTKSIQSLFEQFEVDLSRINDLTIEIGDLDQKYAETDGERMVLNKFLFKGGDFFEEYFFVVAHEIVHWLSRVREHDAYFNDPEEVLGFVSAIAFEMERGKNFDTIWNRIYPKISWHFSDEGDARDFFQRMIEKAYDLIA